MIEQTLSIIKPDAVERDLIEMIKKKFSQEKLKILKSKKIQISKDEAAEFYKIHQTKPFYDRLCNYLSSGPIVVMVLFSFIAFSPSRTITTIGPDDK
jgi:nucleoside-diphosphate kinase